MTFRAGIVAFCTFSVLSVFLLHAEPQISLPESSTIPSVSPGLYSLPQTISFSPRSTERLEISLDGSSFFQYQIPLYLSADPGTERKYDIRLRLFPVQPDSTPLIIKSYSWTIDRKAPLPPTFSVEYIEGGKLLTCHLSEHGSVHIRQYHPGSSALAEEVLASGTSFFVPSSSRVVVWGVDLAGNRSAPVSPDIFFPDSRERPYRILSPASGTWANEQVLFLETAPGVDVRYTVDGSDPFHSSVFYEGPVAIKGTGSQVLRIYLEDSTGRTWNDRILFSVEAQPVPDLGSIDFSSTLVDLGEFGEVIIPPDCLYGIGEGPPLTLGGRSVSFSGIRGFPREYILSVRRDSATWRWVCRTSPGDISSILSPSLVKPESHDLRPIILSWNFVSFPDDVLVLCSKDSQTWVRYKNPIFFPRESTDRLYWYSPTFLSGQVQILDLPPVPVFSGTPPSGVTRDPVFITVPKGPYEWRLALGSSFFPAISRSSVSSLPAGFFFEVPQDASARFSLRILAEIDGMVHGEIPLSFIIDRKAPRVPSTGLLSGTKWSRTPVTFTPSGEDEIVVAIKPASWHRQGKSYILEGEQGRPVDYTVTLSAIDAAGNRSESTAFSVRVDLQSVFVDSYSIVEGFRDGSPDRPLLDLDSAFDLIDSPGVWRFLLSGTPSFSRSHTISSDVVIQGLETVIKTAPDAKLSFSRGSLTVSGCTFSRDRFENGFIASNTIYGEPLIDLQRSRFISRSSSWISSGQYSGSIIRSRDSEVSIESSLIESFAEEYAQLLECSLSRISIQDSRFIASARVSCPFSFTSSTAKISNSTISVSAVSAGRAIEAWDSILVLQNLSLSGVIDTSINFNSTDFVSGSRQTEREFSRRGDPLPQAIWIDQKSNISDLSTVRSTGFVFLLDGSGVIK